MSEYGEFHSNVYKNCPNSSLWKLAPLFVITVWGFPNWAKTECPNKSYTTKECRLWHKEHFHPLTTCMHIKVCYYCRIITLGTIVAMVVLWYEFDNNEHCMVSEVRFEIWAVLPAHATERNGKLQYCAAWTIRLLYKRRLAEVAPSVQMLLTGIQPLQQVRSKPGKYADLLNGGPGRWRR